MRAWLGRPSSEDELPAVKASRDATRIIGDKLPTSAREPEAPQPMHFTVSSHEFLDMIAQYHTSGCGPRLGSHCLDTFKLGAILAL